MTHHLKRWSARGAAAAGLAVGAMVLGAGAASATDFPDGSHAGQTAYGQTGDSVVTYQWSGSSWGAVSCTPFYLMML